MKQAKQIIIRQGDVSLIKVTSLPQGAAEVKNEEGKRIVLAYGEVTGHAHAIYEQTDQVRIWADGKVKYLEVMAKAMTEGGEPGVMLRHEEHTHARIAPGIYKLPVQVEYTPQALRRTAD
jgi:hypothetical protein